MISANHLDLIIAGVGGQGNLLASRVIAEAALREGFSVRIAETYGVTQRGGPVYSQVRIGDVVYGPMIPKGRANLILGLEPIETLRRAVDYLAPGGSVVMNTRLNVPLETKLGRQPNLTLEAIREHLHRLKVGELMEVDALELAEQAGGAATMNVVMIGALLGLKGFPLGYQSLVEALKSTIRPSYLERNLRSLEKGREFALGTSVAKM